MANVNSSRVFDRAIALVQDYDGEQLQWMFVACERSPNLELLWSDRLERESYRESISRELDWRFSLDRKRDYIICSTPRLSLIVDPQAERVISREEALETGFGVLEIYPVQLFGKRSRQHLRDEEQIVFLNVGHRGPEFGSETTTMQTQVLLGALNAKSK